MTVVKRLRELWSGPPQCGDECLLRPGHSGFHKSNFKAWPNGDDTLDWAEVGRAIKSGASIIPTMSLVEMEYALRAAESRRR
jgi:hypothetical protein